MADRLDQLTEGLAARYRVERQFDRGGMATLYLAHDLKHDRRVAIKVLDPETASAIAAERFLAEIRTAARLVHPGILPVHDSGRVGDLLYYVMPYVEGESLRARLAREGRIPIAAAIRIATEIGSAIEHAHSKGIVHRDIKPGNILLAEDGRAWIADFGVARAMVRASADGFTSTGMVVGTQAYMSPEQASGETGIDGRSDVYSLACVVWEMLAGKKPFSGPPAAILGRKLFGPLPPLPPEAAIPDPIDDVLRHASAVEPDRRLASAAGFASALARAARPPSSPWLAIWPRGRRARRRLAAGSGVVGLLAVAVILLTRAGPLGRGTVDAALDPLTFVIFPFERADAEQPGSHEQRLRTALTRWRDVRAFMAAAGNGSAPADPRAAARGMGAGQFITGRIVMAADGTETIRIVRHTLATGDSAAITGTAESDGAGFDYAASAERLLFGDLLDAGAEAGAPGMGTLSVAARRAWLSADIALDNLDFAAADSLYRMAIAADPAYAAARLGVARTGLWLGQPARSIAESAALALAGDDSTDDRSRRRAAAFAMLDGRDTPAACAELETLAEETPFEFGPAYDVALCLRLDNAVLRDPASPSRWSFRTSAHRVTLAYRRALQLLDGIPAVIRRNGYQPVRNALSTMTGRMRIGIGADPPHEMFAADIHWQGDSIAFIPYPLAAVMAFEEGTLSSTAIQAADHQREIFHDIVANWRRDLPAGADVLEAVAVSLEMGGDPAAIDTVRFARGLAATEAARFGLAATEVWLRVKFGLPDDLAQLRRARALADSLLGDVPALDRRPEIEASLAALTGRADRAAAAARAARLFNAPVPAPVLDDASSLLAYSALGFPMDSIVAIEDRVERTVRQVVAPASVDSVRYVLLGQSAALAAPVTTFRLVSDRATRGDFVLELIAGLLDGQVDAIRAEMTRIRESRRYVRPADISLDATVVEAWLLTAAGDTASATDWLDTALDAVRWTPPWEFGTVDAAASLLRAVELRARLASQSGDTTTTRRWRAALEALGRDR